MQGGQNVMIKTLVTLAELLQNHRTYLIELLGRGKPVDCTILNTGLKLILDTRNPDHKIFVEV